MMVDMINMTNNTICRMIMGRKGSEENGEAEQLRDLLTKSLSLGRKFVIASTVSPRGSRFLLQKGSNLVLSSF